MSNVCMLRAVLLVDAFEARLARTLTPQERDAVYRLVGGPGIQAVESELDQAPDAESAALILRRLSDRFG